MEDNKDGQQKKKEVGEDKNKFGNKNYLYIVERILDPAYEEGLWEGSIKSLKKFISKSE